MIACSSRIVRHKVLGCIESAHQFTTIIVLENFNKLCQMKHTFNR